MAGSVALLGGSGFIGSAVAAALAKQERPLRILTRRRARAQHLLLLPQAEVIEVDPFDATALAQALEGCGAVINLVGVLHSPEGQPYGPAFARAHVELPKRLAEACAQGGQRLLHVSALACNEHAPSAYLRSKAAGEAALMASRAAWTVMQPSVVFGAGDHFTNLFATIARSAPFIPLGGHAALMQPVYVGDLVACLLQALARPDCIGQRLQVAGPTVYRFGELVALIARLASHPRPVVPLPAAIAQLQAWLMARLPNPLLSPDNLRSLQQPSVATGAPLPFGLQPRAIEAMAPAWLGGQQRSTRYLHRRRRNPMEIHP